MDHQLYAILFSTRVIEIKKFQLQFIGYPSHPALDHDQEVIGRGGNLGPNQVDGSGSGQPVRKSVDPNPYRVRYVDPNLKI